MRDIRSDTKVQQAVKYGANGAEVKSQCGVAHTIHFEFIEIGTDVIVPQIPEFVDTN